MGIVFDETRKTFTLHTKDSTYQMQVDPFGFLLHLYYGRKTEGCMDYLLTYADRGFSGNPYDGRFAAGVSMSWEWGLQKPCDRCKKCGRLRQL